MAKTVTINQDKLLMLKETLASDNNVTSHNGYCSELMEAAPEVDEYEIGGELDSPVGGRYYHASDNVNESYNVSIRGDLDSINTIEFIPHEDAREEGYEDDEIEDFEPYYEIEAMDINGDTILYADLTVEELFDYFPQSVINDIVERDKSNATRLSNPSINQYRIEDILYRDTTPSDVDNVEEVNKIAKKIQTGGPSAYLLTDGDIIYFHDHIYINNIDGITPDKFIALGNIRLSNGGFELIKEPTRQQMYELKQWIRQQNRGVYVDFCEESHQTYPRTLFSTKYGSPNAERIVNDIYYYFEEGIKPQDNFYESKENDSEVIIENTFEKWFGSSILKDENGQPLKMYHGTDAEFDSFSKEHIGRTGSYEGYGFNFTPFESRARGYNSKRVIEAYLRVTNPMTTKSYNISLRQLVEIIRQLDEGKPYTDTIVAAYEPPRYGENWDKKYYMRALPSAARTIYQYNKENEYGDAGLYAEICLNGNADKFKTIETFEKLGYDSAIFYDNDDRINTVIVFEPNQIKLTSNNTFSTTSDIMGENFDYEVSSSEIDLSSFKKKHELVPNIWNPDGKLNSRIRLKLLDIADDFWEFVNLKWVKPSGIILTGSICNFNWSQYSDIDLHLIVDFDEIDEKIEFVKDYLDSKKNEWNNEHSGLQIMGYPVELYVQNLGEMLESNGIYDLEENDWIREPNPDDIKSIGLNKFSIKDKAAKIMTIIDDMYEALASTDDSHKIEEMGDDASYLWNKVKKMRESSLENDGESGSGNIVYKILRRTGYLDRLWKLSNVVYDKTNSIFESKKIYISEDKLSLISESNLLLNEYLDKDYGIPLYRYFKWADEASDKDKAEDLMYHCPYFIKDYLEDKQGCYDDEFDELIDELYNDDELVYEEDFVQSVLNELERNNLFNEFINTANYKVDAKELPAWMTMDFIRIVKNEWCIHFTSDAYNIAREGFTGGTPDVDALAYTSAGRQKPYAGYDFAFLINDNSVDFNNYGNEAVIFRASGILALHYGDEQRQVVFWGPSVKDIIPIKKDKYSYDWNIEGLNGQIFKCGKPSELADWATNNLPQYRKQILAGKSGYQPYGFSRPPYYNESVKKYITLLKDNMINEETVADGSSNGNPYKDRWKAERQALKNYVCNYGTVMQSKEDDKGGKLYKVFYDKGISELIGYNYALCVQWDEIQMKPKSIVYIRALDKFTPNVRRNLQYDTRGMDNIQGSYDDLRYRNY